MNENDIRTAIWLNDTGTPEQFRIWNPRRICETYRINDGNHRIVNYDYYRTEKDRGALDDRHILIPSEGAIEELPPGVQQMYQYLATIGDGGLDVYISEKNVLDGLVGFPLEAMSIDIPTSPGYQYKGIIGQDGGLYADENTVILESPRLAYEEEDARECVVSLFYNLADNRTNVEWELVDAESESVYASAQLSADQIQSDIVVKEPGTYLIRVKKTGGKLVRIEKIVFAEKHEQ